MDFIRGFGIKLNFGKCELSADGLAVRMTTCATKESHVDSIKSKTKIIFYLQGLCFVLRILIDSSGKISQFTKDIYWIFMWGVSRIHKTFK